MSELFKKAILPLALAGIFMFIAYWPLKSQAAGWELFFQMLFFAGIPFGIRRMWVWFIPTGRGSIAESAAILAFNFIAGGIIGAFVLVWRMIVGVFLILKLIIGLFTRQTAE